MKFYNIFLKEDNNGAIRELILLKYGFNFFAFFFNIFWLLYKKCFVTSILISIILYTVSTFLSFDYFMIIFLLLSIILGFESDRLLIKKYIKEDYKYLGYTSGNNEIEAKRRFLDSINNEDNTPSK